MLGKMTDQEFIELQKELAAKIAEVERLQRIYEGQTGRRFVLWHDFNKGE